MSCKKFESELALYAEGDLRGGQVPAVERHLRECAACREFLEGLRASQAALKEAAGMPLDATAVESVRARVLERVSLGQMRPVFPRWKFAYGAVFAAALLAASVAWWQVEKKPRNEARALQPAPPAPTRSQDSAGLAAENGQPSVPVERQHRRKAGRVTKTVRRKTFPREPLMVKLITDDPNVVIYWYVD